MRRTRFGPPTLIVSDVDGTLIDDDNTVRPLTREAIRRAAKVGTTFVLATGRPPRWIAEIADQLDALTYAVCANGAIVYDVAQDKVLHTATLDPDALVRLAGFAQELIPGCGLAAERVGESAHDAATPPFVASTGYEHAWLNPDHIEVGDDEVVSAPAVKLLVRKPGMASDEMARRLSEVVGDLAAVTFSTDNGLIELALPGINKASGLKKLADIASLPTDAVIAFGDMPNDIEMLRWANRGVAMANAHPAAKDAADEIATSNDNDGVGRVLMRWYG
ncbi:HAD family hydrolase [Williamsia sp.]|uniref:HAD family hydrolase n=1 Tax=Williamsia sp. TaxID=1872085 RepID=UPI001A350353|nr:HAD family hydrolase [Williamsia sp.]MBJ7291266.1 HAD family hydrolase [Williamsia sp.]